MLLGEVDDNDFEGNTMATFIFCLFQFGIVIVLANVLIAIVTDSYSVIKNERSGEYYNYNLLLFMIIDTYTPLYFHLAVVFWSNRLDFVAETDVIGSSVSNRIKRLRGTEEDHDDAKGVSMSATLGGIWTKFMYLFDDTDVHHNSISMEFILYNLLRFGIGCIVIPLWLIVGLFTLGILWPPQVREYLLTSTVTLESEKGEEEIARFERCETLKKDVSLFHEEVRRDIDLGKEELSNLRLIVSGARSGIAAEMKDVKRIVMELYENALD